MFELTNPPAPTGVHSAPALSCLIRWPTVKAWIGLSRSTVDRLEQRGEFPKRLTLATNAVAWKTHEVVQWVESRQARS